MKGFKLEAAAPAHYDIIELNGKEFDSHGGQKLCTPFLEDKSMHV
jgi:hypothetical protein